MVRNNETSFAELEHCTIYFCGNYEKKIGVVCIFSLAILKG